jgi:hypothetical protein
MMRTTIVRIYRVRIAALVLVAFSAHAAPCWAIVANQVDTFNNGTTQNWGISMGAVPVGVLTDGGASGMAGDHALLMDSNVYGGGRLLVVNQTQWNGNWTAAGITQVSMDVKNPNTFTLAMRLGIGGPGGAGANGIGDTFISRDVIPVPADNVWHTITFNVLASDFQKINDDHPDSAAALAGITHFRVLHTSQLGDYNRNGVVDTADYVVWRNSKNTSVPIGTGADGAGPDGDPDGMVDEFDYDYWKLLYGEAINEFIGAQVPGKFYLDNIHAIPGAAAGALSVGGLAAVPEPASWLFMTVLFIFSWVIVRRRV